MKFRELIKQLKQDGWFLVTQEGSHQQYKHPIKKGRVTIAGKLNEDVPRGTLSNILKQANLKGIKH